jgi:MarR family transcriptional regulator for hemolysin
MVRMPSLPYDPNESISYWVINTARRLENLLNEELRPLHITFRQVEVLATLSLEGEQSQVDLAKRLGVEPPTMAGIVARMEENGWIERVACPGDRRKKIIRLTDQVLPIWSQILDRAKQVRSEVSRGLSRDEFNTLRDLLERARLNAETALLARDNNKAR